MKAKTNLTHLQCLLLCCTAPQPPHRHQCHALSVPHSPRARKMVRYRPRCTSTVLLHVSPPPYICAHTHLACPLPTTHASHHASCPLHSPPYHGPYLLHVPPRHAIITVHTTSLFTLLPHTSPHLAFITTHTMLPCIPQSPTPPHHPHHHHPHHPPHHNHNHNHGNNTPTLQLP